MLLHKSPVRHYVVLALIVFAAGAGVGAAIVLVAESAGQKTKIIRLQPAPAASHPIGPPAPLQRNSNPAHPLSTLLDPAARASFSQLAAGLDGSVGLAVSPLGGGPIVMLGAAQIAHAWSTSKVPVLVTLLGDLRRHGEMLSVQDRTNAVAALEQSNNAAIEALFGRLEEIHGGLVPASAAVQQVLREAGDTTTVVSTAANDEGFTTYGQTEWSLRDEVVFYRALAQGCLLDQQDTAYVLGLMRGVIADQRWGAGAAGYPSDVSLAFKGGWGPQNGRYQVRQTAIVSRGQRGYVMSILALPASGAFNDGTSMLTALAGWARRHVKLDASGGGQACARARR